MGTLLRISTCVRYNEHNQSTTPRRKIYLDITNKCQRVIKDECKQTTKEKLDVHSSIWQ